MSPPVDAHVYMHTCDNKIIVARGGGENKRQIIVHIVWKEKGRYCW